MYNKGRTCLLKELSSTVAGGAVTDDGGSGTVLKDADGSPSDMKVRRNTPDGADVLRS